MEVTAPRRRPRPWLAGLALGALMFLDSPPIAAQARRPPARIPPAEPSTSEPAPLTSHKQFDCRFPVVALGAWSAGAPAPPRVRTDIVLVFRLTAIDVQGGSAHLVGGPTAQDVFVVAQTMPWGLHFIENESTGTLSLTSVFAPQSAGGAFRAVHARSSYLPVSLPGFASDPGIAQYVGECRPVPEPARR